MKCKNCGHSIVKADVRWHHEWEQAHYHLDGTVDDAVCILPPCNVDFVCRKPEPMDGKKGGV